MSKPKSPAALGNIFPITFMVVYVWFQPEKRFDLLDRMKEQVLKCFKKMGSKVEKVGWISKKKILSEIQRMQYNQSVLTDIRLIVHIQPSCTEISSKNKDCSTISRF